MNYFSRRKTRDEKKIQHKHSVKYNTYLLLSTKETFLFCLKGVQRDSRARVSRADSRGTETEKKMESNIEREVKEVSQPMCITLEETKAVCVCVRVCECVCVCESGASVCAA